MKNLQIPQANTLPLLNLWLNRRSMVFHLRKEVFQAGWIAGPSPAMTSGNILRAIWNLNRKPACFDLYTDTLLVHRAMRP
jgi:hypothetical protein